MRDRGSRAAVIGMAAAVCLLLPAAAPAADPTTHQYGSSLEQICVEGNLVTVDSGGGESGGAGSGAGGGTASSGTCGESGGGFASSGGSGGTGSSSGSGSGSGAVGALPFTGLDLAVLGGIAAALLGAGFLLRRRRVAEAGE